MARPIIVVDIAFSTAPFVALALASWNDVSSRVLLDPAMGGSPITIRRGRQNELGRIEAGRLTLTLDNRDRLFDSEYASGSFYPNVRPMKRIRVYALWNSVTYFLFTGYIESWEPVYPGGRTAVVRVRASDAMSAIARATVSYAGNEFINWAILSILTTIGWPSADTSFDGAQSQVPSGSYLDQNPLTLIQQLIEAENGLFFVRGDGDFVFQDRHWRIRNTTSAATFGTGGITTLNGALNSSATTITVVSTASFPTSGTVKIDSEQITYTGTTATTFTGATRGANSTVAASHSSGASVSGVGELPYEAVDFSFDETLIYNDVFVTRAGGAQQEAIDSTSQAAYGPRVLTKTGILLGTDDEALALAQWLLLRYKDPALRIPRMTLSGDMAPSTLWPQLLGRELSDKITVRVRPPPVNSSTIEKSARIEAMQHTIGVDSWRVGWDLSLAGEDQYWLLGTSALGTNTRLAY